MNWTLALGIVVWAVIIILLIRISLACISYLWHLTGFQSSKSRYTVRLTPDKVDLVHHLVANVAPRLTSDTFSRNDLISLSGLPDIDPELYFRFKTLHNTRTLTEKKLTDFLERGY